MSDEFIDDPVFGRLRWDDKYTIFGQYEYSQGLSVQVVLDADFEEIDEEEVRRTARKALTRFRKNERQLRLQVAEQLQAHLRDATTAVAALDLANALVIEELVFDEDGSLRITWKRSNLIRPGRIFTLVSASGKFDRAGVAASDD